MAMEEIVVAAEEDVVIIGAGIAGLATAVALKRVGIGALVLERSDELRATGAALTLAGNAWLALDALGVSHKLYSQYAPFNEGFVTNIETGAVQEIRFPSAYDGSKNKGGVRSVHRRALLKALADELPEDRIRFSSKLTSIGTQTHGGSSFAIIHMADGTAIRSKVLIGCDGVHSVVSGWLGLAKPVNSGRAAMRCLAVYPQGHGLKHEVKQFVGGEKRAGFVPLNDQELYCFLVYKPKGDEFMANDPKLIQRELIDNYAKDFPSSYLDVVQHCDLATLSWAPLMFRHPWNVLFGKLSKGTITVAGDAMHPTTPDLGQGGCAALEDAVVLGRHIGESFIRNGGQLVPGEVARALENYVKERRWRVAWLITASYLSGWAQQSGSGWWRKFFRDVIFYKFLFSRILTISLYDCGKLPDASYPGELDNSRKKE